MKTTYSGPALGSRALVVSLLTLLLLGCGGGISLSGVGSGGSGIAEGSISGFGSVIVNGVEYDDSNAVSQSEDSNGVKTVSAVKLGQRVRVTQSKEGVADTIEILPLLRGPVSSSPVDGTLQVMGQWVQVVSVSGTSATATVLDRYDSVASIAKGDSVEVHGVWQQDAVKGAVLVASRIEKLTGSFELLITGQVTAVNNGKLQLNGSGVELNIGSLPPMPLGSQVTAWLSAWDSTATLQTATRIKDAAPLPPDNQLLRLDVIASATDISGGQLRAQGRTVSIPANLRSQFPSSPAPILLEATLQNGVLTASSVQVRNRPQDLGGEILLKGAVSWDGTSTPLTLREASVAIDGRTTIGTNCPHSAQLVFLEIHAQRGAPGSTPTATSITCLSAPPADGVIRQGGVVLSVAVDLQSLTVMIDGQTSPTTMVLFDGTRLPPNGLTGLVSKPVDLEYQWVAGRNQLRALILPPPPISQH
jgi:hypothetical protein